MSTLEESTQKFPRDTGGLPAATAVRARRAGRRRALQLRIAPVTKRSATPRCGCWPTTARFPGRR